MAKSQKNNRTVELSKEIVSAWFKTVINPLLGNLEIERKRLDDKYWTWRFHVKQLELIRPIEGYLAPEYYPNYEQFCDIQKEANEVIESHDNGVKELTDACNLLYDKVEEIIRKDYFKMINATKNEELWGQYPKEDRSKLLAQYVVNNIPELSDRYLTAKFWNTHKKDFLALREQSSARPLCESVFKKGETLRILTQKLILALKDVRMRLSLEYGVPYVSPSHQEKYETEF